MILRSTCSCREELARIRLSTRSGIMQNKTVRMIKGSLTLGVCFR